MHMYNSMIGYIMIQFREDECLVGFSFSVRILQLKREGMVANMILVINLYHFGVGTCNFFLTYKHLELLLGPLRLLIPWPGRLAL